ncbi:ASCH domain-containing protein [Evansella sp. LMS18]
MGLYKEYFHAIKEGKKTVEVRRMTKKEEKLRLAIRLNLSLCRNKIIA